MNKIQIEGTITSFLMNETKNGKVANLFLKDSLPPGKPTFKVALWKEDAEQVEKLLTKGDTVTVNGSVSGIFKNDKGDLIEVPNAHLVSATRAVINYENLLIPNEESEEGEE